MILSLFMLLFFLLAQGFYSGMETGLVSLRRPRVENEAEKGSKRAKQLLFFLNNPGLMISTTLLGVNISVVCASLSAKKLFVQLGFDTPYKLLLGTALLSIIMLSCEIIPKNWFREAPFKRCSMFIRILSATYCILYLPAKIFNSFTSCLTNLFAKRRKETPESTRIREDLRLFFKESENAGKLPAEAADILDNAIVFHQYTMKDVMTPIAKMPFIRNTTSLTDALMICRRNHLAELPISHTDSPENWYAVFSVADAVFDAEEKEWKEKTVADFQGKALRVDSSAGIIESIQKARKRACTVFFVEEKGKIIGAVSLLELTRRIFAPDN